MTSAHHPRGLIAYHNGTSSNNSTFTDGYTGSDEGLGANPDIRMDLNWTSKQLKVIRFMVMASSTQMDTLRNNNTFAKGNRSHGITGHSAT
jgi:hypothetical protein